MQIPLATLHAIAAGEVTLAFRRWDRARVKPGTLMRTGIGLVEVTSVEQVTLTSLTAEQARRAGFATKAALRDFLSRKPGGIFKVGLRPAGPDPRIALRQDDNLSPEEREAIRSRLAVMDRNGAWTMRFLTMIEQRPAVRAPDLAASIGWETLVFKRYVRKLKELGLTESLEVGYRLSPRGRAVLAAGQAAASLSTPRPAPADPPGV
jgi:hypothetical protein